MRSSDGTGIFRLIRTVWKLDPQSGFNVGGMSMWISVPLVSNRGERHPARRPLAVASVVCIFSGLAALTVA